MTIRDLLENGTITLDTVVLGTLPMTADGAIALPGSRVSCPHAHDAEAKVHNGTAYCTEDGCWDSGCQGDSASGETYGVGECYSTREAAEAAKGKA